MDSKAPQENSELQVKTPKDEVSNKEDGNLVLDSFFGESREKDAALSEFESNSMDDEESPPFLYNIPQGQP